MARDKRWATTPILEGTATTFPLVVELLPAGLPVAGLTVIRVIGNLAIFAQYDGSQPRTVLFRSGVLVGPTPSGAEISDAMVDQVDWLWLASEQLTARQGNAVFVEQSHPSGVHGRISSSAQRRLEDGESLWLVMTWFLFGGHLIQNVSGHIRALTLLPA